jgi:hypothetical protein
MAERIVDAFCHVLPPRYEDARWRRAASREFVAHSPSHL